MKGELTVESDDSVGFSERVLGHATVGSVIPVGDVDDGQSKLYKWERTKHTIGHRLERVKIFSTDVVFLCWGKKGSIDRTFSHLSAEGRPSRWRRCRWNDDRSVE